MIWEGGLQRAVVLRDKGLQPGGQAVFASKLEPVRHMREDHAGAGRRIHLLMDVLAGGLVLDEELRAQGFARVMVECSDPCEKGVGADGSRGLFRQVCHLKTMLIGAGSITENELEQGMIRAGKLDELQAGCHSEQVPDQQ